VEVDLVVQVRAGGVAGAADHADDLAGVDVLAGEHGRVGEFGEGVPEESPVWALPR